MSVPAAKPRAKRHEMRREPTTQQGRLAKKRQESGQCPKCGKPSYPYFYCKQCRTKRRAWAKQYIERRKQRDEPVKTGPGNKASLIGKIPPRCRAVIEIELEDAEHRERYDNMRRLKEAQQCHST